MKQRCDQYASHRRAKNIIRSSRLYLIGFNSVQVKKIIIEIEVFVISKMSEHNGKDYTEICSERTIFSDQQGFFGEMFEIVKNCCTKKWLKEKFEASPTDADKFRLLFDEPDVSDMLLGTLEHVTSIYRKKDAAFAYQRRREGELLHQQKVFDKALMLLTHAVLRAPAKGKKNRTGIPFAQLEFQKKTRTAKKKTVE